MDEAKRVEGRVVTCDGYPVVGALIALGDLPGMPEIALRTDGDGRFSIVLPWVDLELTAHAPKGAKKASIMLCASDEKPVLVIDR